MDCTEGRSCPSEDDDEHPESIPIDRAAVPAKKTIFFMMISGFLVLIICRIFHYKENKFVINTIDINDI